MAGIMTGRTVLITDASSGLGAHLANLMADHGANAVLGARRIERTMELSDALKARGGQGLAVALDVTDEGSVRRAFETAEQVFGRVDTVIANAGINIEGSALELDASALDDVFRVNVNRVFVTVREAARRLISAGSEHH